MAVSEYDKLHLTATQQAQLQKLTDEYNVIRTKELEAQALGNASLAEDYKQQTIKLHEQAEQIRAGAPTGGYSGGATGGDYVQIKQTPVATSTPKVTVTDYSDYITKMNEAKKKSALAELKNAYDKNVNAINRAEVGLGTAYQQARNQTAGASELAKRNNAEYAAAYGLNTGTGGQMELARNVTLQNNLNTINTQEAQSVADIQLQRANAETEYNNAIAKAQATGDYELAAQLYQEKVRVEETLLNLQVQQAQREYQAYRDSVADNQWQLNYALQAEKLANAGSSSSGAETWKPELTYNQVMSAIENGQVTPAVEKAFEYYNDIPYDEYIKTQEPDDPTGPVITPPLNLNFGTGDYTNINAGVANSGLSRDEYDSQHRGNGSAKEVNNETEYNPAYFRQAMNALNMSLSMGGDTSALSALDGIWGKLSAAQKNQAINLLHQYGYEYTE